MGVLLRGLVRAPPASTACGRTPLTQASGAVANAADARDANRRASPSYDKNRYYWPASAPLPDGVSSEHGQGKPLSGYYFENRLCVEAGRGSLSFSRIREGANRWGAPPTRVIATGVERLRCGL